jgi:DNA-binding transcriptional LysR family regulator
MQRTHEPYDSRVPDRVLPPDLDLRLVRYFTVVAEYQHFGRAAEALYVAQPYLSRQIRSLEQLLDARLFHRTPQGARLTEAGDVFLPLAKELLDAAAHAATRTRSAAEPSHITVGYLTSLIVTPAVRELLRRRPEAAVQTVHLNWNEPRAALLDHRVDVAIARLPFATEQLDVVTLYEEPRVLLVAQDHRLAGRPYVTLDDIADEPMPRWRDPGWNAFWRIDPRPDGRPAPDGPVVEALDDKFDRIASGELVVIVAAGLRATSLRPDLATVPLRGVAPSAVVLATRSGDANTLVSAFRECALDEMGPATSKPPESSASRR